MLIKRSAHLRADLYERSEGRNGYANGLKDRSFQSSVGPLALRVPQTRESDEPYQPFYARDRIALGRSLKVAIAEMYLQGVSTRRVTKVMEKICGLSVSSTQVSRLTAEPDDTFELWRKHPLPEIAHLIIDATYIKVRIGAPSPTVRSSPQSVCAATMASVWFLESPPHSQRPRFTGEVF